MTDEKIFRRTIRPTCQRGTEAFVKTLFGRFNGLSAHQKAWHLLKTSIPISSVCATDQTQAADSGTEECVYREASGQFDLSSEATSQIKRRISEQIGHASLRGIPQKAKTWLRNLSARFKCNISLTERFSGSFFKFIVCWFLKDSYMNLRRKYV
jgi:hypothetical protein